MSDIEINIDFLETIKIEDKVDYSEENPPLIIVETEENKYLLIDGYHRLVGGIDANLSEMDTVIIPVDDLPEDLKMIYDSGGDGRFANEFHFNKNDQLVDDKTGKEVGEAEHEEEEEDFKKEHFTEGEVHVKAHTREGGDVDVVEHTRSLPTRDSKYEYSSTQVNLPDHLAEIVREMSNTIPTDDLAEGGRESVPHITVKYGLHGNDPLEVSKLLAKTAQPQALLGEISIFEGVEHGTADAVIITVFSPDLQVLNKVISKLSHTDTYSTYKPHITLAYVKPGLGMKYVGSYQLLHKVITFPVLTFSGKDGIETDIPFLPRSADPSVSVSDSSGVQFNDYVIDYWFEDADYVIEDTERFKLGVWTPVTRWRGQDVQNLEVQAYTGPDGKRRYRTRVKKAQTKQVPKEERTGEQVDLDLKRLKELRTKHAEDIQPIKLAEESLETVRTDFAGFGQAAPIGHVPDNLEKLLKNSIALQAKLADLDSQLRMAGRREKIRGNKGLLLETTKTNELKELVELYEDAADHIGAMTRRFFDRLDEWKEQFGMTSLNTELDNWHDADKQVTDTANVTTSLHTAMFCLNKLPAYLRHSLKVFKDGINISTGGIYTSAAYPEKATPNEIKTQKKWAGMYFGAHDGKIIVENAPFGMANTIVHEIAHAIDYEILGLSMLPAHGWKKTRLGREFDKYWQVMKDQFEEYGQTNPAEGFATALTMYLTNDDWMRSHQPGIYHWIDENIGMSPQHREYKRRWREIVKENEQKAKAITEKQAKGEF